MDYAILCQKRAILWSRKYWFNISQETYKQKLDVSIDNLDSSKGETLAIAKQDNPEIAPPSPGELIDFYTKLN